MLGLFHVVAGQGVGLGPRFRVFLFALERREALGKCPGIFHFILPD